MRGFYPEPAFAGACDVCRTILCRFRAAGRLRDRQQRDAAVRYENGRKKYPRCDASASGCGRTIRGAAALSVKPEMLRHFQAVREAAGKAEALRRAGTFRPGVLSDKAPD